ncbi:hypothetical protein M3Y99_01039900 [Aphelenchoides fujianensis]|nr:hypothetical protein M3Y99_01039900 [Aphelenchoides fujianensis]
MRFWAASLVLLLVLLSLVAATGKHAKNSKAKHPVHKQVAHKHAPAHKKPAHHGPAHRAVHHHVQKKRTNKKAHRNCLSTTCAKKSYQKKSQCKAFCKSHEKVCGGGKPGPEPEEKCGKPEEKYKPDCIEETCTCDADCAPASDKRYEEKCWPATCIRPEEQGDKQNAACKTWCEKAENKDKCKGDDKPKPTAPDCTKPETKFTEECLPTTCPTAKDEAACKLYCGRAKKDDKACTGVTAITCDAAKTDAECLPHFCRIAANKDNAACIPYCKTKPEEKGECVGVSPEVDTPAPPGKGCETKTNNDRFDTDNCWQYSCKKQALKTEAKCVEHCNVSPEQEDFACAAVAPGAAAAACTADEFANDACTKHACRVQTNKANDKCKDYCDKNKKDKVCIGVEPKPDAKCDAEDKKYTQECISYTCRKTAEKDKPECENLCLYKADDDACAL